VFGDWEATEYPAQVPITKESLEPCQRTAPAIDKNNVDTARAEPSLLVAPAMADAGPDQEIRVTYGGRAAIGLICRA